MTIHDFDEIRPYEPEEMPVVFEELLNDRQFNLLMKGFVPWLPKAVRNGLLGVRRFHVPAGIPGGSRRRVPDVRRPAGDLQ